MNKFHKGLSFTTLNEVIWPKKIQIPCMGWQLVQPTGFLLIFYCQNKRLVFWSFRSRSMQCEMSPLWVDVWNTSIKWYLNTKTRVK